MIRDLAILLERGVGDRSHAAQPGKGAYVVGVHRLDQAKVDQLAVALGRELDIRRLDVAVEHRRVLAVEVAQRIAQLVDPAQDLCFRQKAPFAARVADDTQQVGTGHVIHHQIVAPVDVKKVGHLGQVGVVEAGQHHGLTMELLAGLCHGAFGHPRRQPDLFDRTAAPGQAGVFGQIDRSHAALPDQGHDAISLVQHRACNQTAVQFDRHETLSPQK